MRLAVGLFCLLIASGLNAQPASPPPDPAGLLGLGLGDVLGLYGAPLSVRSVRGPEPAQDDVVFAYEGFDLYIFKDRVWQVAASSAYGVRIGDGRAAVSGALGEPLLVLEGAYIYQLPSRAWPVRLRVGFGAAGSVAGMYVFRADY